MEFSREELDYLKASCEKIAEETLVDDMWLTVTKVYDAIQAAE